MKDDEFSGRWDWCEHCDQAIIHCKHCGNTSCNGSGCEKCLEEFKRANVLARWKTREMVVS